MMHFQMPKLKTKAQLLYEEYDDLMRLIAMEHFSDITPEKMTEVGHAFSETMFNGFHQQAIQGLESYDHALRNLSSSFIKDFRILDNPSMSQRQQELTEMVVKSSLKIFEETIIKGIHKAIDLTNREFNEVKKGIEKEG